MKLPKQEYTPEFRELADKRVKAGQSISSEAKDLGLVDQTPRNWVKAVAAGKLNSTCRKVVTPEQYGTIPAAGRIHTAKAGV